MIWAIFAIGVITWIILEILQRHRHFQLREELGLSGPPASFISGNIFYIADVIKKRGLEATPQVHLELEEKYGSTYGFYFGCNLEIVTSDPAIIKEVFISQFGNFVARKKLAMHMVYPIRDGLLQVDHVGSLGAGWKEMRTVITAIFTSGKMKKMHLMFHDQLDNLVEELRTKSKLNGGTMDIYAEYQAMTMDMISRCALGQNISCLKDRSNEFYTRARKFVANLSFSASLVFKLTLFFPFFKYLRPYSNFGREEKVLTRLLSENILERQKERASGKDQPLHHDVIVSNAWALFVAGYETTSTTLAYASYLLAKHPEKQQTLYEEIASNFEPNEAIDYERVMKLPYLHAVFSETLRVYPPVLTFTGRRCIKDTIIGGNIRVPAGVSVVVPVHTVMWNENNFEQPREFIPERFMGDNGKAVWSATYLPFGIGPRNCVGARFAEMEFKTVLAEVTRKFITELDPEHKELKTVLGNVLHGPKEGVLFVKLTERT